MRGFVASALAVGVVVGAIAVIYAIRGGGDDSPTITAAKTTSATPSPSVSMASPTSSPSSVSAPSIPPASTSVPPTPTPTSPPVVVPGSLGTIYVYSAPGGSDKVDAAAARFTAAGYAVNQRKAVALNPSQTTVYYDNGMAGDAAAMVAANLGVQAAAPRPPEYLSTGTLFVVVTANFS